MIQKLVDITSSKIKNDIDFDLNKIIYKDH